VQHGVEQGDRRFHAHEVVGQVQAGVTSVAAHHVAFLREQFPGRFVVGANDHEHPPGKAGLVWQAQHVEHLDHAATTQHTTVFTQGVDVGQFAGTGNRVVQQLHIRHQTGIGSDHRHFAIVGCSGRLQAVQGSATRLQGSGNVVAQA